MLLIASLNITSAQLVPGVPGIQDVTPGSVRIEPFVQAGYRNISFNLNLPFRINPVDQVGSASNGSPALDLSLSNVGTWVGGVGIDARLTSNLFMVLKADGIIPNNNVAVRVGEHFPSWWDTSQTFNWNGHGLEWWDADCMLGLNFAKD